MSTQDYKTALKTLLDSITFDSSTLGTKKLVKTYKRSVTDTPNTTINIFQALLGSDFLENVSNRRTYNIVIRIQCLYVEREEQASLDIDYLEEQIVQVLENALSNSAWGDGWEDNEKIQSIDRELRDNYYTKDIPLKIYKWVHVTN